MHELIKYDTSEAKNWGLTSIYIDLYEAFILIVSQDEIVVENQITIIPMFPNENIELELLYVLICRQARENVVAEKNGN